jgi:hypothetical protein
MKTNPLTVIDYLKNAVTPTWLKRIEYGIKYNLPIGVDLNKTDYEALTCAYYDLEGTGKSSGDNDHNNGDETKGASKIKPKNCKCGQVCHYFQESCKCGSTEFIYSDTENSTDSRWGIDTAAHFRYKVPNYHMWILEAEKYEAKNKTFLLKLYSISSENEAFNEILKIQNESKSKHKNFLPYSKDFYASNPKYMACFKITLGDIEQEVNITSEETQEIVLTKKILTQSRGIKKYLPKTFVLNKDTYHYEEIKPLLNIRNHKTSHGKQRGETKRRFEQNN